MLVPPVGLLAAWKSYQQDRVDLEAAVWIALAFAAGAYLGAAAVRHIPAELLRLCFGFLMLYIAVRFIVSSNSEVTNASAGLVAPTGLAVAHGLIYISNYGVFPGTGPGPHGEVVSLAASSVR